MSLPKHMWKTRKDLPERKETVACVKSFDGYSTNL